MYVGPGAAIRGDWGGIVIEDGCNVQENCTVHMFPGVVVMLEAGAHIGHGAVVHGARIGANALIGMNAVVMDNATVGAGCIVGALCFVPTGMQIPARKVVVGNPAKIVKDVSDEMLAWKTEGTALYQQLPAAMRDSWKSRRAAARGSRKPADAGARAGELAGQGTKSQRDDIRAERHDEPAELCDGRVGDGHRPEADLVHAVTGEKIGEASSGGLDFAGDDELRDARWAGPRFARSRSISARRCSRRIAKHLMERKEDVLSRLRDDRRDESRLVGRHRRWHRNVLRLLEPRPARVSERDVSRRRPDGAAVEGRHVRRPAHPRAARRRRDSHQRVQLPVLGHAREDGARAARRRAVHREAGNGHELPHGGGVPRDRSKRTSCRTAPSS